MLLAGQNVIQYQMSTSQTSAGHPHQLGRRQHHDVFGAANAGARVREIIRDTAGSSYFMQDHGAKVIRSQDAADLLNAQFAAGAPGATVPAPTQLLNPITRANENNALAIQLQTVAKVIAANSVLGMRRQVFFVSIGGFDNHDIQNTSQSPLMARLAHAHGLFRRRARQPRRRRHAPAGDDLHRLRLLAHLHHQRRRHRPRLGLAPVRHGRRRARRQTSMASIPRSASTCRAGSRTPTCPATSSSRPCRSISMPARWDAGSASPTASSIRSSPTCATSPTAISAS